MLKFIWEKIYLHELKLKLFIKSLMRELSKVLCIFIFNNLVILALNQKISIGSNSTLNFENSINEIFFIVILIKSNYKPVFLKICSLQNINNVLITDHSISNFKAQDSLACDINSTICNCISNIVFGNDCLEMSLNDCRSEYYLYFLTQKSNPVGSASVRTEFINSTCKNIDQSNDSKCAQYTVENCATNSASFKCDTDCKLIKCIFQNFTISLCVDNSTSSSISQQKCQSFKPSIEEPKINESICIYKQFTHDISNFGLIIISLSIIILVIFITATIFYNYKVY